MILATPQINLYHTTLVSDIGNDDINTVQHNCLRVVTAIDNKDSYYQILSYCMSEIPSKYHVIMNDTFSKFTFIQLTKQNITSEQLYLWSAPIDIIENYQFYLNSNESSLEEEVYYNCTLPRFGPLCQYEFDYFISNFSFLHEIIFDIYQHPPRKISESFTCYKHLQCNRGPLPACLDWSEICNKQVDCIDNEIDEENCWQLEINQCKDTEFRCPNGQCVPRVFSQDNINVIECLDDFDDYYDHSRQYRCTVHEPSFDCEDIRCKEDPSTSACGFRYVNLLKAIFSIQDSSISDYCWNALKCKIDFNLLNYTYCSTFCLLNECIEIIEQHCPDLVFFPAVPVLFSHIYFAYFKNHSQFTHSSNFEYPFLCYNHSRYDHYFLNASKIFINNTTCYFRSHTLPVWKYATSWTDRFFMPYYRDLWEYDYIGRNNYSFPNCNISDMYQCENSIRCISVKYVQDGEYGCPYGDDENENYNNSIILTEESLGIHRTYSYELKTELRYIRKHISFQTICDGFTELAPINIDGQNETDETQCEQWQCNNIYTRCNGLWNCLNGEDEIDCNSSHQLNCSSDQHLCISPHTNKLICLPIIQANDGKEDCLGGFDEPESCRQMYFTDIIKIFHCWNQSVGYCLESRNLCDVFPHCTYEDDENFCENSRRFQLCDPNKLSIHSDVEKFVCSHMYHKTKQSLIYFSLNDTNANSTVIFPEESLTVFSDENKHYCHRGFSLRIWLNNTCLCPPSYYGSQCQYQNQRISLSLKFRVLSDSWQIPFAIVILLIDNTNERIIHSYEQLTYLSVRDCQMKFHLYLLYSTRPKNSTRNYSIHIDIYEKISLNYRGSLLFPVHFPFLPVHRLAFIIEIPKHNQQISTCSNLQCKHGKCIQYLNQEKQQDFCQCDFGWSGKYCQISHHCTCDSLNSKCIGISSQNRSICICNIKKFGPRCLINTICQMNTCENNGQCIPTDEYMMSHKKFRCICKKGFSGDRCEIVDNQIILSFTKDIVLSSTILIHFIEVMNNTKPIRATSLKIIQFQQDSLNIRWSQPFHIVFIEIFPKKLYYLTVVQKNYNPSTTLSRIINSSNHCPHISEIFNDSFSQWHLLRRIKFYHLACQQKSCFYDDIHFCLCYDHNDKRLANCFEFDHHMTFDCLGESVCENGGQCFQEFQGCPRYSTCICPSCFYGFRCQFSTSGFGISLDAILGYDIRPGINILHQSARVQLSLVLIIIFILIGIINSILSIITFKNKVVCQVGCGLYLLSSSITTLLMTIILGCKFFIFYFSQINSLSNRSFLQIQCISLDFLLRLCLNMDQWFTASVACERAITAIKGVRFDKNKSKQSAKIVIIILLIFNIGTTIHDPIHRRLLDEENNENNELRIWCITSYSSRLQTFNHIMFTFSFFTPFMINLISTIILITKKSRLQSNTQTQQNFIVLLRKQCKEHRHLLIAPVVLIIIALPRLIISYVSKCMNSVHDIWLFLIGYFISFVPSMVTFIIFVLPSKFYKKEFKKSIKQYRTVIRRRLYLISSE